MDSAGAAGENAVGGRQSRFHSSQVDLMATEDTTRFLLEQRQGPRCTLGVFIVVGQGPGHQGGAGWSEFAWVAAGDLRRQSVTDEHDREPVLRADFHSQLELLELQTWEGQPVQRLCQLPGTLANPPRPSVDNETAVVERYAMSVCCYESEESERLMV